MPALLSYETASELAIVLENKIGFYRAGIEGPIPVKPENHIYQIKVFCPSIRRVPPIIVSSIPSPTGWESQGRELPEEDAAVILAASEDGGMDITSEWYGVDCGERLKEKYKAAAMIERIKTGDFSYEVVNLRNDSGIYIVHHGTSLDSVSRLLQDIFTFYEVPEANREWKDRLNWISQLRMVRRKIGDPNRLFRFTQDEFDLEIQEIERVIRSLPRR